MKRWFLCLILVAMIGFAAQPGYYPGALGYSWQYSNGEEQVLVSGDGGTLVLEHRFKGRAVFGHILRYTPKGVLLEGVVTNNRPSKYDSPLTLYPAPPLYLGQEWGGRAKIGGQATAMVAKVVRVEAIKVPAGRYNAYVIRTSTVVDAGGTSVVENYYVPGVGIVRYVSMDGDSIDLIKVNLAR
jgi:hypothetical protein